MSRRQPTPVNIRNFSVKCGRCGAYPDLAVYEPAEEVNTYRFECDVSTHGDPCPQIILEIPTELDEFANRDPKWGGGKVHAGADGAETDGAEAEEAGAEGTETEPGAEPAPSEEAASEPASSGGLLRVLSD